MYKILLIFFACIKILQSLLKLKEYKRACTIQIFPKNDKIKFEWAFEIKFFSFFFKVIPLNMKIEYKVNIIFSSSDSLNWSDMCLHTQMKPWLDPLLSVKILCTKQYMLCGWSWLYLNLCHTLQLLFWTHLLWSKFYSLISLERSSEFGKTEFNSFNESTFWKYNSLWSKKNNCEICF